MKRPSKDPNAEAMRAAIARTFSAGGETTERERSLRFVMSVGLAWSEIRHEPAQFVGFCQALMNLGVPPAEIDPVLDLFKEAHEAARCSG